MRLLDEGARLITFVGTGGIGKSRVASDVARAAGRGVVTCDAADAATADGLLRALALASGIRVRGAPIDAARRLTRKLCDRGHALVLLDNVDAVLDATAVLVPTCLEEGMVLLVTSREPLGIEGEHVIELGPLDRDAAIAMFRARAGSGSWKTEDLDALIDHLDGLPLAIELAARRARLVPPRELVARLDDRFRLLKSDRRDVAKRHATLAASLESSLERLSADEHNAFVGLGLFDGPVELEAFEAVLGPLLSSDPLDVAQGLLRKSLVMHIDPPRAAGLSMLRTLRAFARTKLGALDGRQAAEERFTLFYMQRAEAMAARAYGAGAERALDVIESDLNNLLMAFTYARAPAPANAARIAVALGDLAIVRNMFDLRAGLFAEARALADTCADELLRVRTRIVEAKATLEVGRADQAEALSLQAIAMAHAAGLAEAESDAYRSLGWARFALGHLAEALEALEKVLAGPLSDATSARGQADALAVRGLVRCLQGAIGKGHRDLESAYGLHVIAKDTPRRQAVAEMAKLAQLDLGPSEDDRPGPELAAYFRAAADAHRAGGRLWREAIDRLRLADLEDAPDARRAHLELAQRAASEAGTTTAITASIARAHSPQGHHEGGSPAARPWVVGGEARWVESPDGTRTSLVRHGSLRRVLDALVVRRLLEPGVSSSADALLAAGWPGERLRYDSGMLRVYTAIRRLRALGLERVLVTRDDGYLLDPQVTFERGP
jgi:predicted ATPase